MIRIVLGEDHALLREGTRHILEQHADLRVVGEAGTGEETLSLITRLRPDVAILDIKMPRLTAIEIVRQLVARTSKTKCLILTAYDDDDFVLAAMESGASGYLLKTVRSAELADAVRAVHRGQTVLHPDISRKIAIMWARRELTGVRKSPDVITQRELEILELAARGLRNKEIANTLGISLRTVEGHFSSILSKLGVRSRTAAVVYAAVRHWFDLGVQREEGR